MRLRAHTDQANKAGPDSKKRVFGGFSIVEDELARVRRLIGEQLSDCSEPVRGLVEYVGSHGGKMLRPGLVLLSGAACGKITREHIRVAAIVEMIHNATLLHDDVVDEGKSRRGIATVNCLKGNESAVLLGDFLLSRVFKMCAGLNSGVCEIIASAACRTCEGELMQVLERGNWRLGESEYIEIIADKSAALFGVACLLGARLSGGGRREVKHLADYGHNTGIAFQIVDDLLDITGDENDMGKTLGRDADKDKVTLPVIHLLDSAGKKEKSKVIELLSGRKNAKRGTAELVKMLINEGCLEYARRRARQFSEKAIEALAGLRESEAKDALIETARFVVSRTR
jgi:octaprenyl-diphosphate synthase